MMQVGSRVVGKTRRTRGRIGIVLGVNTEGRQRKFEVEWSCGTREAVAARSITLAATQEPLEEYESVPNASTSTFTDLLLGVNEGGVSVDMDSSSSSDEVGLDCEEGNEQDEDDGAIYANGRKWTLCESVLLDPGAHVQPHRACLLWPQPLALGDKTLAKYFYLMYPMSTLRNTMSSTNYNLQKKQYRRINVGDWFKWIGMRLAMAFEPRRGPLPTYWNRAPQDGGVSTAANFGQRFGMTRHCFEQILSCMSFGKSIVEGDPWMPIRPFLDGFNERRLQVVSPGSVLCVDESMSAWKGREGKYCHDGIPHKTKIVRKPEGLGAELKAIADGDTGIILGLELVEGATRQRQKPYAAEYGEGTAVVLRLAERFRGTGRTVVADSAFASVKTLIQLEARTGLFFMGMVKTATVGFPMKHLKEWFATGPNRGSFKVLSSTTDMGTPMYAACWADKKPKTIIANRGTTLPGTDAVRPRHRLIQRDGIVETLRFEKRIQRPQMIEYFFSKFSTVDVHNHLRQGSLALEREWATMFWGHRLFSTLLGMITVDAYLAYRYESCDESHTDNTVLDFHGFLSQLAHQLIFNDFHSARTTRSNADGSTVEDDMLAPHKIEQLIRLPQYAATRQKKYRAQRKCNLCREKASYYCVDCSDTARGVFYCVCGPRSTRDCFTKHLSTSI